MFAFDAYSLWRSAVGTCTCGVSCAVCMNALSGVLPHVVARRKCCITNYLAPFEQISETHGNSRFTAKDIHKFGKAPSLITRLHKNDVIACRESLMIYLTAEGRLCFLFDFLIRHLRCRTLSYLRRCYWKRCFANLFFPTASMDSQLAGQNLYTATLQRALQPSGRTNPNAMASFPGPYRPQPLPERMSDRMPVYLYLSICLSV